jgi:hypothetical protein
MRKRASAWKVRPRTSALYYSYVEATRQNLFWPDLPGTEIVVKATSEIRSLCDEMSGSCRHAVIRSQSLDFGKVHFVRITIKAVSKDEDNVAVVRGVV